jgi:hypothetical protein
LLHVRAYPARRGILSGGVSIGVERCHRSSGNPAEFDETHCFGRNAGANLAPRVLRRAAAVRCFVCLALLTARLSLNTIERMSLAEHPVPRMIFAATRSSRR